MAGAAQFGERGPTLSVPADVLPLTSSNRAVRARAPY